MTDVPRSALPSRALALCTLLAALLSLPCLAGGLSFEQMAALRSVNQVELSPDGRFVAFTLTVPRRPGVDDDGAAYNELHVIGPDGVERPYVTGDVSVGSIAFTPDGAHLTYLTKRGDDEQRALWAIPVGGGESRRLLEFDTAIEAYDVSADGKQLAFIAKEPLDEERETREEDGYNQEVFEEDWVPQRAWIAPLPPFYPAPADPAAEVEEPAEPRALPVDGSVWHVAWSPDGLHLALDIAPRPLIDDRYMKRKVTVVAAADGKVRTRFDNPGKLGEFVFSPDGAHVAMISAEDPNDPKEGRLLVGSVEGGGLRDLLPVAEGRAIEGHVSAVGWRDARTVLFVMDSWSETVVREIRLDGDGRKTHSRSDRDGAPLVRTLSVSRDGRRVAFRGESPSHPGEAFSLILGESAPRRLTDSNPWLGDVELATQETIRFKARDGMALEGVLIRPLQPTTSPAPLLLMVHGGPEGHDRNGWVTAYSRPGQLAAARGFAVLYPNYRGSTGRGVPFSKLGQGDAAGKEFEDLVDAVDHLVAEGIADRDRVGILGGSYGGYATAWCGTRFSDRFRAGAMFVGISNKVSKGMTTEIPVEDKMVHTRFDPWTRWDFSLDRSPLFHAEKSRTAMLIAGGTADTRVDPSQSLQLYRALKLIGKTPVRYVRYPGEGHGNRRAAARDDYARRIVRWMEHFVADKGSELPPWELARPDEKRAE